MTKAYGNTSDDDDDAPRPASNAGVPQFFQWVSNHHPPHSLAYSDRRETFYASHPTLGTITQSHLSTSTARLLIPRGILREPTSLCHIAAVSRPGYDAEDEKLEELYFADTKGCRLWRMSIRDDVSASSPELLYQSYRSPYSALHLQSLADYQRDDASEAAQMARRDERMHVRGVAVTKLRHRLFWCQGPCVMSCSLDNAESEPADARSDILVVAEGVEFESVEQMWVDGEERWLCLKNGRTGEEHRLFLAGLSPREAHSVAQDDLMEDVQAGQIAAKEIDRSVPVAVT